VTAQRTKAPRAAASATLPAFFAARRAFLDLDLGLSEALCLLPTSYKKWPRRR
jgi:hypothetical protein